MANVLQQNFDSSCVYYEPFAGGAGAALKLLHTGAVSRVHLNDADFRIYSMWKSLLKMHERFVDAIRCARITISNWKSQLAICADPKSHSEFDVGFATFFLNRCNRSGIILGSRPIGGMKQTGNFDLAARFNKESLISRIKLLSTLKQQITVSNKDAIAFLRQDVPRGLARSNAFVYLDPPYFSKGKRLYLNYYTAAGHRGLANYIRAHRRLKWLMSYDDHPEIRELYRGYVRGKISVDYSLSSRRTSTELLIAPPQTRLTLLQR